MEGPKQGTERTHSPSDSAAHRRPGLEARAEKEMERKGLAPRFLDPVGWLLGSVIPSMLSQRSLAQTEASGQRMAMRRLGLAMASNNPGAAPGAGAAVRLWNVAAPGAKKKRSAVRFACRPV